MKIRKTMRAKIRAFSKCDVAVVFYKSQRLTVHSQRSGDVASAADFQRGLQKAKKKHATVHSTASPSHRNRDADAPIDLTTVV